MSELPQTDEARHAAKMAKKKAARDKIMEGKTEEKGLIIVHTGKGKGKSSAAFGMVFRCIAHGFPCAVVQFIKGAMATGERQLIEQRFSDQFAENPRTQHFPVQNLLGTVGFHRSRALKLQRLSGLVGHQQSAHVPASINFD